MNKRDEMNALKICQLTKTYKNGVTALKGIDLSVAEGDFFALLGPNGAGKSTTIGIVTSLINKTSGRVEIFGHDLDTQKQAAKRFMGLVPQEFNAGIFEPIEQVLINQAGYYGVPYRLAQQRAEICLKRLELWSKRKHPARMLSGGMKRRLMIARALMHEPKILILDEPTAGVDIEIRRSMWDFLRELNQQGTTIILTTHYLEEAESLCKNIAIIDQGKIIENTSIKNLLKTLRVETFIFYLAKSLPGAEVPKFPDLVCRLIDDTTIEIDVPDTVGLSKLFALFAEKNIVVMSMKNKVNRLEEFFVRLIQKGKMQ